MNSGASKPLKERLHALAEFLPEFERPDFEFGHWEHPPSEEPGVTILSWFELGEVASAFVQVAYEMGWVWDFDWVTWMQTPEATNLRDNPLALAHATPDQLAKLLTVFIRQDRFCEGALESAYEQGLLTRIVRRAAQLESGSTRGQK